MKTLKELSEKYDLEIDKILSEIKKTRVSQVHSALSKRGQTKAKRVLLQFPNGFKPYATAIVDLLEEKTNKNVEFLIWFGSCFGACDTPILSGEIQKKIDLVVQFGHNEMLSGY